MSCIAGIRCGRCWPSCPAAGVERIELAPFSLAELAEHLEAIAGGRCRRSEVERIHACVEGDPFFAEQLLAAGAAAMPGRAAGDPG